MLPSHRKTTLAAAAVLAALGITTALTSSSAVAKVIVAPGYYTTLVLKSTPSTAVSFEVTKTGEVKDLILACGPVSATIEATLTGEALSNMALHGPKLKLNKAGGFSYSGSAWISGEGSIKKIGTTALKITAKHVDAPTIHYTFEGNADTATRAYIGKATSPACIRTHIKQDAFGAPLYHGGQFQLFL